MGLLSDQVAECYVYSWGDFFQGPGNPGLLNPGSRSAIELLELKAESWACESAGLEDERPRSQAVAEWDERPVTRE